MSLSNIPKRYRYPVEIIGFAVWSYHRFNDSFRDEVDKRCKKLKEEKND